MPRKNIREMSRFELFNHSIGAKTFRAILVLVILIGLATILFSYMLYSASVRREFKNIACNLAKTTATISDKDLSWDYSYAILKIYDETPEELKEQQDSDAYKDRFKDIQDAGFLKLKAILHNVQVDNNADSIFIAALDVDNQKLIYLVDSDYTETFCPPGKFEDLDLEEVELYLGLKEPTGLDRYFIGNTPLPAYISDTEEYGYICTAADELIAGVRGYKIMAFADVNMDIVNVHTKQFLLQFAAVLLIIAVFACWLLTVYFKRRIVVPVNQLASAAESYRQDKRMQKEGAGHFEALQIDTGDELENLSLIMKDMEKDIAAYEQHLTAVTAEKERIGVELSVGRKIQAAMVPHTYPAFPDYKEFDVFATMSPAKEIGGDFYDFFLIDEDHLAVVMADVSGKGIPAALFMMVSKILIKNVAGIEKTSPAAILERVNSQICKNNDVEMFVTVWLGILQISTGKMVCANAGHEYPAIRQGGAGYQLFKDPHGFVVGGMDGMKYKDYELTLKAGDALFVYTDGVTEAANTKLELFGTNRMIETLNTVQKSDPLSVLTTMKNSIDEFVKDADQFDDITMMSLIYYGAGNKDEV